MPAISAWRRDSWPSVAEIVGLLEGDELDGKRAGLEDEGEVLRLVDRAEALDLGAVAGDAVGEALVVDLRPRADLVVEHDREVLGNAAELPALRESARDVVEAVAAPVGELERHDRLALEEVLAGAGQPQILTGHLRDRVLGVGRVVVEEVVEVLLRLGNPALPAGADHGRRATRDHDLALGRREVLGVLGHLPRRERVDEVFLPVGGPREKLVVRGEEVPLRRRRPLVELVLPRQERPQARARNRVAARVDRRPLDEVRLQVVELELRRLADDLGGAGGVEDAGEVDRDLVGALPADLGLGDAELVDAVADDLDRAIEILIRNLTPLRRLGLEDELEPALQVEAERRRAEEREDDDAGQDCDEAGEDPEVATQGWVRAAVGGGLAAGLLGLRALGLSPPPRSARPPRPARSPRARFPRPRPPPPRAPAQRSTRSRGARPRSPRLRRSPG